MKRLLVLGAGTAGTMAVNKMRPLLPREEWSITIVDPDDNHYYQPGYLFIPFGIYRPDEVIKPKKRFIPTGVDLVKGEIDQVDAADNKVLLVDGTELGVRLPDHRHRHHPAARRDPRHVRRPGRQRPRVLHLRGRDGPGREAAHVGGRPPGRAHHRDADQVPRRATGVHLPRRRVLHRAGPARQGRDRLRDPARGRLHQAGRQQAPRRHARHPQDHPRGRLHDREHRRGGQEADQLRRARGALRPAGHDSVEHGRGLHRPLRPGRRPQLRPGRQADTARQTATTTSSWSATPPTSRHPRPARSRTSRWTCSRTTSCATSRA